MNKRLLILILIFHTALGFNCANAQYTKLLDFAGGSNGGYPCGSFISDGTYLYGMTRDGGIINDGTIFKINITTNAYTKIFDFRNSAFGTGRKPYGSLISDGTYLYGMTAYGGANDKGTAFKIQISNNAYTKILDFAGVTNGGRPYGSLISDGTYLYGMSYEGGANNLGTAFKIQISNNAYTKILDFTGTANGSNPWGSFISDGTYLYGMTLLGGANNNGTAFKIQISNNAYTKILDFKNYTTGGQPQGSFISDGTYLYGMTYTGGANNRGTAFKIQISNNAYTRILNFDIGNGFNPWGSFISDGTYLYGMTCGGGENVQDGTAFKIEISNNAYTKILDFNGTANGSQPLGSFILDGKYLYGMTSNGGTTGNGVVFKYQIYSPEIDIQGNYISIEDGTTSTSITNNTYLGSTCLNDTITKTYTIKNIGNFALKISSITISGAEAMMFNVSGGSGSVAIGDSLTFKITFLPKSWGEKNATINIINDDLDEGICNFAIKAVAEDLIPPIAPILTTLTSECSITAIPPTTTDNCSGLITGTTNDPLTYNSQGNYIIHWTFKDIYGNTTTVNQNIIIADKTAPIIPTLATVTGECSASVSIPTTTDNCSGTITGTTSDSLTYSTQGNYTIHWIFNDGNGNSTTANQNVIITGDNTAPLTPTLATLTGECSVVAVAPTTTDNCRGTITGTTNDPLTYSTQGNYTIHWIFNDGNGNSTTANQNVIITGDITAPLTPTLAALTGECSVIAVAPTTIDNCSGVITGTTSNPLTYDAQGNYAIYWTFIDGNGNNTIAQQTVIIDDVTAPIANVSSLPNITSDCSVTSLTAPTATDNCKGMITAIHNATLPITTQGTTVITWTYDDGNGNISTQTQNVVIIDNTAPVPSISILSDISAECSVTSLIAPTAMDNCNGMITATHNATLPITIKGTSVITWTYDDGNGNIFTQTQNVIITDNTVPVPSISILPDISAECSVTSLNAPTATDNCKGMITAIHNATLPITTQGTTVITWTYDDGNGNISAQTQNVLIEDQTNPTLSCIENQSITLNNGETFYTIQGSTFNPISYNDNCENSTIINDFNNLATLDNAQLPIGLTTIVWTVTDVAGNTTNCSFNVDIKSFVNISENKTLGIHIFPNPTSSFINIDFANSYIKSINISDITGKSIIELKEIKSIEKIDLSNFYNGIYILTILTENEVFVSKIVKE